MQRINVSKQRNNNVLREINNCNKTHKRRVIDYIYLMTCTCAYTRMKKAPLR